jgi:ribosome-binding factor A
LAALKERSWFFRKEIARQLKARVVPRLAFQADLSFEQAQKIDLLLKSEKVKKDVNGEE